jgi:hypothetical protein
VILLQLPVAVVGKKRRNFSFVVAKLLKLFFDAEKKEVVVVAQLAHSFLLSLSMLQFFFLALKKNPPLFC